MLSNLNNPNSKNTFSFQAYKYNTKYTPNKIRYNTRYGNSQNKDSAPIASNSYNNQFLYKSENKKGYNQMSLPAYSLNNDVLLINPQTFTSISKGKISHTQNSMNWNNIGFKEVKWKNNFSNKTYNNITNNYNSKNKQNLLFQSYNINNNYGATAKNLGFYNINTNTNSTTKKGNNNNILYFKKNSLFNSYASTSTNSYNNINNTQQKNSLYNYYKNIVQIQNAREGLNSKVIKDRMTNEENIKKINKIQAVWKGIYVRELMDYYWNFNKFQEELAKIIDNYYKKDFLNKLKNYKANKKQIESDKLLEEYNNLLKQFNEYKKNIEKYKNNEYKQEKINFEILSSGKVINVEEIIINNIEENEIEKEEENIKLKSVNKKKLNDFSSQNLNIIKNDKFCFNSIKKEKIYEINNSFFSLINNLSKPVINDNEKISEEKNKIFVIENQKGFYYEKEKVFNKDDLSIEKKSNLNIINNKTEPEIKKENKQILLISNKSDFTIKNAEKKKCDKMTEITEEINPIKENKIIFKKENNYIQYKKEKKEISNYNSVNEIEKGDGLEINPYEIKRTKIKSISKQNDLKIIISNEVFKEKSKKNLMKIIFPIRLKEILIKYIKKNHYLNLINKLKKISFISILLKVKKNREKNSKKKGMEKLKERIVIIKLRKYFEKEIGKYKIQILAKKYLYLNWNKGLLDLSKNIIKNKSNKSLK